MSLDAAISEPCQVDFYVLREASLQPGELACRLAMMAWERHQRVYIVVATEAARTQLDEQMWHYPEKRFLPHTAPDDPNSGKAPVTIGMLAGLKATDVVINLSPETVPQMDRYERVLEIVPYSDTERQASRVKYKTYRDLGLEPQTHEINN